MIISDAVMIHLLEMEFGTRSAIFTQVNDYVDSIEPKPLTESPISMTKVQYFLGAWCPVFRCSRFSTSRTPRGTTVLNQIEIAYTEIGMHSHSINRREDSRDM